MSNNNTSSLSEAKFNDSLNKLIDFLNNLKNFNKDFKINQESITSQLDILLDSFYYLINESEGITDSQRSVLSSFYINILDELKITLTNWDNPSFNFLFKLEYAIGYLLEVFINWNTSPTQILQLVNDLKQQKNKQTFDSLKVLQESFFTVLEGDESKSENILPLLDDLITLTLRMDSLDPNSNLVEESTLRITLNQILNKLDLTNDSILKNVNVLYKFGILLLNLQLLDSSQNTFPEEFKHDYEKYSNSIFNKIVSIDPTHSKALMKLVNIELEKENYSQAETYLRQVLEYDAENAEALYLLGAIAFDLNHDYVEALSLYKKALENGYDKKTLVKNIADILIYNFEFSETEKILRDELRNDPEGENWNIWIALSHMLRAVKLFDGFQTNSDFVYTPQFETEKFIHFKTIADLIIQWKKIEEEKSKQGILDEDNPLDEEYLTTTGQLTPEEKAYNEAFAHCESDSEQLVNMALLLEIFTKNYDLAEYMYNEAISLDNSQTKEEPHLAYHWYYLGSLLAKKNRYEESEKALRTSLKCDPENFESLFCLYNLLKNNQGNENEINELQLKIVENFPYPKESKLGEKFLTLLELEP